MICALAHPPAAIDVTVNALSIAYALTTLKGTKTHHIGTLYDLECE